ncbi:hypothetical protein TBLA_0F03580 [Henningerozyma blattae CBS 6284]|uniref:Uncharacterized protein n=1 Tax=Henningerozyma blattae (strain ATCC 34711 / CBS 6284 / DSM 70876 / NBRC 10599 / NRRL Y-10934 / UCD 77-7) TaxID=1071380 RepID=I2H693_HENB6|nr:hypothetical protein TBLA_0F03580 [Tetrapisispora blattae CBS 6284]CCH61895.1 hypothetical protein TBLA_0F03580 [Tetrapisispora blattae CBS 6284]
MDPTTLPQPSPPQQQAPPANLQALPPTVASPAQQIQYKVQLLLHINSILIARVIQIHSNAAAPNASQEIAQHLKRVHSNLQCISQINQGVWNAKPSILDAPTLDSPAPKPTGQSAKEILAKLYLLLNRLFEIW